MATTSTATTTVQPRTLRWPLTLYERAAELGLFEGRRVELIAGEVVEMAAKGPVHSVVTGNVAEVLARVFPRERYAVRNQEPLALGVWDEPEPDVAVVTGRRRDYLRAHPTAAQTALVVEVADSTLVYDLGDKADIYAAADIADYWVVAAPLDLVVVCRARASQKASGTGWRYAERREYRRGESITPLADANLAVPVADLLP